MKILILAQNPKTEANLKSPLRGTKSWTTLARWLKEAGIPESAVDLDNASLDVGSISLLFREQAEKNLGRWAGMIARYPVIVTLGEFSGKAIASTRNHFRDRDWLHFHLVHPSGLNRKLNDPKEHEFAVALLKQAYAKFLTLQVNEDRMRL